VQSQATSCGGFDKTAHLVLLAVNRGSSHRSKLLHLSAWLRYLYDAKAIARKSIYANSHAIAVSQRQCRPNATTLAAARALKVFLPSELNQVKGRLRLSPAACFTGLHEDQPTQQSSLRNSCAFVTITSVGRRGRSARPCQSPLMLFMYTFWSGT